MQARELLDDANRIPLGSSVKPRLDRGCGAKSPPRFPHRRRRNGCLHEASRGGRFAGRCSSRCGDGCHARASVEERQTRRANPASTLGRPARHRACDHPRCRLGLVARRSAPCHPISVGIGPGPGPGGFRLIPPGPGRSQHPRLAFIGPSVRRRGYSVGDASGMTIESHLAIRHNVRRFNDTPPALSKTYGSRGAEKESSRDPCVPP
jgi:hypothetical protein